MQQNVHATTETKNSRNQRSTTVESTSELVDKIEEMAPEIRVNPEWIEFNRPWITLETDSTGRRFVSDDNNIIRYYVDKGVLEIHPEQHQREDIVDGCERHINLESVMEELVHGSGRPLIGMNTPFS